MSLFALICGVTPAKISYICRSLVRSCEIDKFLRKSTYLESLDLALQPLNEVLHVAAVEAFLSLFFWGMRSG